MLSYHCYVSLAFILLRKSELNISCRTKKNFFYDMSRQELLDAKILAIQILDKEYITKLFRRRLCKKGVDPQNVIFDYTDACKRIMNASFLSRRESEERRAEICGETWNGDIWIIRGLDFETQVETLLHEALHDSVFIHKSTRSGDKKGLSETIEHDIMYRFLE